MSVIETLVQALIQTPGLYLSSVCLFALAIGSFLNVVIARLPGMLERSWTQQCRELLELEAPQQEVENLIHPRSRCPACRRTIKAIHNVPVVSYLALGGRCGYCGAKISLRYPIVEVLTSALSVVVALRFGFTPAAAAGMLFTWLLIALSFIDFDHQILPDGITLPGLWIGLLLNSFGVYTDLYSAVYGAAAGYLVLWAVYHLFRLVTGKEGMGFGDFKLLAMIGAWLGWQMLPLIILVSALAGSLLGIVLILSRGRDKDVPMPFGPYLAAAGWVALLWGRDITELYLVGTGLAH